MQLKRVSSDEIKRNYTKITGREALERLLAGETVYDSDSEDEWKIIDGLLFEREYSSDGYFVRSNVNVNAFLNSGDTEWYVAPPFDARKEMLARPGEWSTKYLDDCGFTRYLGFDPANMLVAESISLEKTVAYDPLSSVYIADIEEVNRAIPLDDADLAKLAALKADEKGVEA